MTVENKYFMIPFASVPDNPDYAVWFATWATARPAVEPGALPPFVVGLTTDEQLPAGAVLLASGGKDPPPPPPPPPADVTLEQYKGALSAWLLLDRGA